MYSVLHNDIISPSKTGAKISVLVESFATTLCEASALTQRKELLNVNVRFFPTLGPSQDRLHNWLDPNENVEPLV